MPDTAYPDSYLRDPLHVAKAVEDLRRVLTDARRAGHTPTAAHLTTVTRLASLHSVLASLTSDIGDEITARADVHTSTTASRLTTRMFVAAAQYASDALVHLGQAIGHAQRREAFTGAPGSERSHARHTEHLGYELAATTTELGHLATALRREHLASGYTYPCPAVLVTGIEPDTTHAKADSAPEAPTRDAALRRSPIHAHASSTPDPAAGIGAESLQPARRDPRAGHR